MIRFLLNKEEVTLTSGQPDMTVLQYLREQRALTGSKEGCAAGDCGACTVVVAEYIPHDNDLKYRAINSCVTFLSAIHGKQLITVEHLADKDTLHPVQQAMVDEHGSQCGFCTPGFIMSMFAFYQSRQTPTREQINIALSGNLCRCTGYKPIITAMEKACENYQIDQFGRHKQQTIAALKKIAIDTNTLGIDGLYLPQTTQELKQLITKYPDATLVAGSTDLALEVTQKLKALPKMISLGYIPDLKIIKENKGYLDIGAACSLNDVSDLLTHYFSPLSELIERFASMPIRNQATLGGNVANASPIGDLPPVLLALNANIHLDNGSTKRVVAATSFFIGYRTTALLPGEWIEKVSFPLLNKNAKLRAYKVSKRLEDDISAVCAVFKIELENNHITSLTTGFGGVAATPVSCAALSEAMIGLDWRNKSTMQIGLKIVAEAFEPIDDVRATAEYRKLIVSRLWHRLWLETSQQNIICTRVNSHA